jgi:hypothetical protein
MAVKKIGRTAASADPAVPPRAIYEACEPQVVPIEYSGRWVAWSSDCLRIVAVGDSIDEVSNRATEQGETEPILERISGVPRGDLPL